MVHLLQRPFLDLNSLCEGDPAASFTRNSRLLILTWAPHAAITCDFHAHASVAGSFLPALQHVFGCSICWMQPCPGKGQVFLFCRCRYQLAALKCMCVFVEQAMSYRSGHHSTSDDSSRYRTAEEMGVWRARDPATRFHNFIVGRGWWDADRERQLRVDSRKQVTLFSSLKSIAKRKCTPASLYQGELVGCG